MWRTDSDVPEVAPAPAAPNEIPNPDPGPGIASVISPVIAPSPEPGGGRMRVSPMVSLTKLLRHKSHSGKSHALRNGVMIVLGLGLVAGAVKLMLGSGGGPKTATAASPAVAPAATPAPQPGTGTPAAKNKGTASGTAKSTSAKPAGGLTTPATANKSRLPVADPKATKRPAGASSLGPDHVDKAAGYAVRFPTGWTRQALKGGSWLAQASDGKSSSMAVGLASDGGRNAADASNLAALTKAYQGQPNTVVQGAGFGTVAGLKCMWHKLSFPAPAGLPGAAAGTPLSVVQYFAPLGDGRALKVRVVSRQETFAEMAPRMKQSLDTLRLLDREAAAR